MLKLQTDLEGKTARFGDIRDQMNELGYDLGGNWGYDAGSFDSTLWCDKNEKVYLRLPFTVLDGMLDEYDAFISFQTPFVIKHVVNIGLEKDKHSLLTASGFNQFQDPVDPDAQIQEKNKWETAGEKAVSRLIQYLGNGTNASGQTNP
ncbi:YugN family protein [Domibacillus robiginosus]|uniref:YugN family protein n=1 Tax=Domibacillus robiginosus TaxID=1071054 RepID=UPI00067E424B|nr:YugN family protein [Domibacillus robiginosus]